MIGGGQQVASNAIERGSRINADVERVIAFTSLVNDARDRVARHSSALGYFSEAPGMDAKQGTIQPISNNLQTALSDLDRALDSLHGALSLFE